jgi:hypothetical protein
MIVTMCTLTGLARSNVELLVIGVPGTPREPAKRTGMKVAVEHLARS